MKSGLLEIASSEEEGINSVLVRVREQLERRSCWRDIECSSMFSHFIPFSLKMADFKGIVEFRGVPFFDYLKKCTISCYDEGSNS